MRLSAEMYEQIVAGLKSDSHRDKDKRREPRVGLATEAEYVSIDSEGKRTAGLVRIRDISQSGIGLSFPKQMEKKQRFVVQLYNDKEEPLWLVCLSAYCRRVDGGRFSVGARIHQILKSDQIQKLEAHSAVAAAPARQQVAAVSMSDIERISKAILG
jgi:hypothetical protein